MGKLGWFMLNTNLNIPTTWRWAREDCSEFITAIVKLLKKPSLDRNNLKNYRPVSNLSFLSKSLEKKNSQPTSFSTTCSLLPVSLPCRTQHWDGTTGSDEWHTACFGRWQHFCLNSLGLVSCIQHHGSQDSTPQTWKSLWYFRHCSIMVRVLSYWKDSNGDHRQPQLKPSILCFGVSLGSVLGPVLYILYTKPLSNLIECHSISSQSFADDTQLLAIKTIWAPLSNICRTTFLKLNCGWTATSWN